MPRSIGQRGSVPTRYRRPCWSTLIVAILCIILTFNTAGVQAIDLDYSETEYGGTASGGDEANPTAQRRLSHKSQNSRLAYATLLYGDAILGARVLGQSLRETGTEHDLVIIVTEDVTSEQIELLTRDGWIVKRIRSLPNPYENAPAHFNKVISKLYMWTLTEYERVVYLDLDTLVLSNIDELFDCAQFCASVRHSDMFNSGVMVLKPDMELFEDMVNNLQTMGSYTGGDQGFLNEYFNTLRYAPMFNPKNPEPKRGVQRLSAGYNADVAMYYLRGEWLFMPEQLKIIHYTLLSSKPWKWWGYPLLDLNWEWNRHRERLQGGDDGQGGVAGWSTGLFVSLMGAIGIMFTSLCWGPLYTRMIENPNLLTIVAIRIGPKTTFARFFPLTNFITAVLLAFWSTPNQLPPRLAYLVFPTWLIFYMLLPFALYLRMLFAAQQHMEKVGSLGFEYSASKRHGLPWLQTIAALMGAILLYDLFLYFGYSIDSPWPRVKMCLFMIFLTLFYVHSAGNIMIRQWSGTLANSDLSFYRGQLTRTRTGAQQRGHVRRISPQSASMYYSYTALPVTESDRY
eukprot:Clim_evm6s191 gene=Clim_evmTU6s191